MARQVYIYFQDQLAGILEEDDPAPSIQQILNHSTYNIQHYIIP